MESFPARLGHLSAAGYVVSALIPLLPSVLIAVEWPFSTEKPPLLVKILPQRITEAAHGQGGDGDRLARFNPGEMLLLPTRFSGLWRVTPDVGPEKLYSFQTFVFIRHLNSFMGHFILSAAAKFLPLEISSGTGASA